MTITLDSLRTRFGNSVAAHRKRLGWKQSELAEHLDMSEDMIARVEAGKTGVSFKTIVKLSETMRVDPSTFFCIDGSEDRFQRSGLNDIIALLAKQSDTDVLWLKSVVEAALTGRKR